MDKPYISWFVLSFTVYFILEVINQRSLWDTLKLLFLKPHIFLLNLAIVAFVYSIGLYFKRKLFTYSLITFLWLVVGGINLVLLIQRNTQFNASDIVVFQYGMFITMRYFNAFTVILLVLAIAAVVFGMVVLCKKGHKFPGTINYKTVALITSVCAVLCAFLILLGDVCGFLDSRFTNIDEGYKKNGFLYSFGCSLFEQGIEEPENYDSGSIQALATELEGDIADNDNRPNVIFIQLESFIDPEEIKGLEFENSPIPNFKNLMENYPSGYLRVPVVGGGTANTEFEILTGMNLKHFGTIELPYESLLLDDTCESMPYNYKALGYSTHAIHNFSAGFYKRNTVYSNLGFDTFTSFEYMTDIEYNDIGWAKDKIIERYIFSALESTENSDFVFAVTVQGHGSYPNDFDDAQSDISSTYFHEDISDYEAEINYYVSQIHEMDEFIGSLTDSLTKFDEDTVVVFYGDHLPGININPELLERNNLYETEYVIWSNFELEAEAKNKNLQTYRLAAYVQELLGFSSGKITKLHQRYSDDKDYQKILQTLEYDIIEGDDVIYGSENPYLPTEMKLGVEDIKVRSVDYIDKCLYVNGVNFNEHSAIYINGTKKSTVYLNSNTLMIENVRIKDGDEISVGQINYQMPWTFLTKTDPYICDRIGN